MGIMVYSLLWVMQDFDHQQYGRVREVRGLAFRSGVLKLGLKVSEKSSPESEYLP